MCLQYVCITTVLAAAFPFFLAVVGAPLAMSRPGHAMCMTLTLVQCRHHWLFRLLVGSILHCTSPADEAAGAAALKLPMTQAHDSSFPH